MIVALGHEDINVETINNKSNWLLHWYNNIILTASQDLG